MAKLKQALALRVTVATMGGRMEADVAQALTRRGITVDAKPPALAAQATASAIACAPPAPLTAADASDLADTVRTAAEADRPFVILSAFPATSGKKALERACAEAYLEAHGAILTRDPDVWMESLVLLAAFEPPAGTRCAIVAPDDTWLARAATSLAREAELTGKRQSPLVSEPGRAGQVDAVLVDPVEFLASQGKRQIPAVAIPVSGRSELLAERPALVGLRASLGAVAAVGQHRLRRSDVHAPDAPSFDNDRIQRQLDRAAGDQLGDHESKVLLSAAGVDITRQAVATTPSAAATKAKKVGFPVEIKPWDASAPSEPGGCPVEADIRTAAEVRRAFQAISAAMNEREAPVIVREPPPSGRQVAASIRTVGDLGPFVVLRIPGVPEPIACPAPLSSHDALALARSVSATRAGEPEPNRNALAELLSRASHLVAENDDIASLELFRIVIGAKGERAVVVDARTHLVD